jgi:membrane protein implicated in regulation of membrane protease activity
MAALCAWTGNKYSISMDIEVIFFVVMSLLSFMMTRVWQQWIDNPDDYEKLYKERLRRFGRRMGGGRRKRKDKKKDSEE